MPYVFDTNSFRVLGNYYPDRFPTFWRQFNQAVINRQIISVKEVHRELESQVQPPLSNWVKDHKGIFIPPTDAETRFITSIFSIEHFRTLVRVQNRLTGIPCADPFVIAKAESIDGCVVTEETLKPNAAKIPNVCEHYGVDCTNLQGLMEREGWTF